jgi:polysaccharide biosynthesis protein PslG
MPAVVVCRPVEKWYLAQVLFICTIFERRSDMTRFATVFMAIMLAIPAHADLTRTVPDDATITAATAACEPGTVNPPTGILGISDPHADDPDVIDLIASTGVTWVRAEFYWSVIEPEAGAGYRWATYDAMVRAYNQRGINVLGILTYIPDSQPRDWAQIDAVFQDFANATVARYAPRGVHYWEVFNEPNLPGYGWLDRGNDAGTMLGAYTLLLARANAAVRAHDPKGVVVIGGLASDQHRGLAAEATMDVIYGLGAKACFDVMAYHPYGYQNRFPEARARIDAILAAHRDRSKPVWFNEYGWTQQAEMDLARNPDAGSNPMLAALGQRDSADALFWFAAKDYSGRNGTPAFGLATFDLDLRPSFETFRSFVAGIR